MSDLCDCRNVRCHSSCGYANKLLLRSGLPAKNTTDCPITSDLSNSLRVDLKTGLLELEVGVI